MATVKLFLYDYSIRSLKENINKNVLYYLSIYTYDTI